eukprot:2703316-Alexandrium_andersonii.AAC.1
MSASLVGSEMCIRDRCRVRIYLSQPEYGTRTSEILPLPKELGGGRNVAVSYTHLTLPTICSV